MRPSIRQLLSQLSVIGCANGLGGRQLGCEVAASVLRDSAILSSCQVPLKWESIVSEVNSGRQLQAISGAIQTYTQLANEAAATLRKEGDVLVVAGDHSSAIGTWSGVANELRSKGDLGLIWVDAHMDAHTPSSSPTGNIHGMPVAHLLGFGDKGLSTIGDDTPKIRPENLCLVGIRSFEPEEQALLDRLGVRVFFIEEVERRGIAEVMQEAVYHVSRRSAGFGLSIDIDAFDVVDAPAVGTPEKDGIRSHEFLQVTHNVERQSQALLTLDLRSLVATEIVEFLPKFDDEYQTSEKLVVNLIETIYRTKSFQTTATATMLERAKSRA